MLFRSRLGRRYRRIDAAARVQMTMNACLSDPARVNPRVQELIVAEVRGRDELPYVGDALLSSLRGLLATFTDPTASRPWALARTLDLPVLVVYGSHDTLVDPHSAALASRAFRGSTVVVLPDCGHVAQMEWPDVVANLWQDTILDVNRPVPERAAP